MSEAAEPVVVTEKKDHLLIIRLNREKARNAVNGDVARGIEAAVDQLEEDDQLWAGVLAANGPTFCAGADLKAIATGKGAELSTKRGGFGGLVLRKRTKPLIAAVHSDAFAGGFELVLACDMVVAAEGIKFGLPEVKRSLVALAGGLVRLPGLVGEKVALEIALTGEPVTSERLDRYGLINRLVPKDRVLDEAIKLGEQVCANGPLAVRASRDIIVNGADMDFQEHWDMSIKVGFPVFKSEDAKEGPRAFIEKRQPVWQGR